MTGNPHPEFIVDEVSGVTVPNDHWAAWQGGRKEVLDFLDDWQELKFKEFEAKYPFVTAHGLRDALRQLKVAWGIT